MEDRPFMDEKVEPTEKKLKQALQDSYLHYVELINISDSFSKDWNFSKSSGWMLKVYDRKKALFYLIPLKKEFKISMAIRENERKTFLEDNELKEIHNVIKPAKKYREGYAIQFNVDNDKGFKILKLFIKKLIALRI